MPLSLSEQIHLGFGISLILSKRLIVYKHAGARLCRPPCWCHRLLKAWFELPASTVVSDWSPFLLIFAECGRILASGEEPSSPAFTRSKNGYSINKFSQGRNRVLCSVILITFRIRTDGFGEPEKRPSLFSFCLILSPQYGFSHQAAKSKWFVYPHFGPADSPSLD